MLRTCLRHAPTPLAFGLDIRAGHPADLSHSMPSAASYPVHAARSASLGRRLLGAFRPYSWRRFSSYPADPICIQAEVADVAPRMGQV